MHKQNCNNPNNNKYEIPTLQQAKVEVLHARLNHRHQMYGCSGNPFIQLLYIAHAFDYHLDNEWTWDVQFKSSYERLVILARRGALPKVTKVTPHHIEKAQARNIFEFMANSYESLFRRTTEVRENCKKAQLNFDW